MIKTARDGTRYEVHGEAGPALVLIHGLGLNQQMWRWQLEALRERYRVLTYDLFGLGESPPVIGKPTLSHYSDQLAQLLDEVGMESVAVAGFSLGGMIARRFAMDHPERLWALAVLNSGHRRSAQAQAAIEARVAQLRTSGPAATVDAALGRWLSEDFQERAPETVALIRKWIMANEPEVYSALYQMFAESVQELVAPDPPITCPALIMTGEHDAGQPPAHTMAIAAEIPDAVAVVLPDLRHMPMVEDPERFNDHLLAFLDRVVEAGGVPD